MIAELLVTGTELTDGRLVDTNSPWLLARLRRWGADPRRITTVGDDPRSIEAALREAAARADLVVVSGGLGPTSDDLTAACAARVAEVGLIVHQPTLDALRVRYAARGRPMTPMAARMADLPAGAEVLANGEGTAPGFRLAIDRATCFFFAGVPREFRHLCEVHLGPWVLARRTTFRAARTLRCVGVPESELDSLLLPIADRHGLSLGLRAAWPESWATLAGEGADEGALQVRLDLATSEAMRILGTRAYSTDDAPLPEVVGHLALARGARIATAESCTGGLAGGALTEVPGSSAWYVGGFVTYANELKTALLGVDPGLLATAGAVSEQVAQAMAEGARTRAGATHAIAITGVAGPGGGSLEKPVGLVWIAVATPSGTRARRIQSIRTDRASVRELAVATALDDLRLVLLEQS